MISRLTGDFRRCFKQLPKRIQKSARKSYKIWKEDFNHPGIDFKRVSKKNLVFSVRVAIGWRALGIKRDNMIIWFWIGSHADYEGILKQL